MKFELIAPFEPTGDQPQAIEKLTSGLKKGFRDQTLLGITGSGKTFTMAHVIAAAQRPTLILSHNKTLAAQLASEFRTFFPKNAVHYFVSYYDYYQPEAYIPRTDTYIEKETELNEEIDRLRHASTQAILSRRDTIIVASVSCIYSLGSPEEYKGMSTTITRGAALPRSKLFRTLTDMQYTRTDIDFKRGTFRVRGDLVEIYPIMAEHQAIRLDFFGDTLEKMTEVDALTGETITSLETVDLYPARHYIMPHEKLTAVLSEIRADMEKEVAALEKEGKILESHRLRQRTTYDLEMIETTGFVSGIENYSRYFDGRVPGQPPYTLIDFFPKDYLLFIDESHMSVPQIGGMSGGDRARKEMLVRYGFRLRSAYDNRPLRFDEFDQKIHQVIYVSATPGNDEIEKSQQVVEQLIRPTGLLDPTIELKPTEGQIDDLLAQIQARVAKHQRVLVTTLTKRMAEELTEYLREIGIKVQYLHSEITTLDRLEILRDLRLGVYDAVVGINLLREGLDLPEVSLVAILDADKEGFLRSTTSLIQTIGRAARHVDGHVIMYADRVTDSMKTAMEETRRRRAVQEAYNHAHGITPKTIEKAVKDERLAGAKAQEEVEAYDLPELKKMRAEDRRLFINDLTNQMNLAAQNLEFEKAATLRDQINVLKQIGR
jgi:excinuclease ABC subunit B